MGLDQYARRYSKSEWKKARERELRYVEAMKGGEDFDYESNPPPESIQIAYWRKHPYLQGWMENLWESKGRPNFHHQPGPFGDFNCVPVELTLEDLDQLEEAVKNKSLPETVGFFFGDDASDEYRESDLEFIEKARKALEEGDVVVYDSWW